MKKIQFPMVLLGLFCLLIPAGIAAQFILAVKYHRQPTPPPVMIVIGSIPLVFGAAFIYLGIRLQKILYQTPKMPIIILRAWVVANFAAVVIFSDGHLNPIALVLVPTIYWYFSWALRQEIGDDD